MSHIEVVQLETIESAWMGHNLIHVDVIECLYGVHVVLLLHHHQQPQGCHLHPH